MGAWQIPPEGGHMELPTGLYYQTMNGYQVQERLKKNDLIIIPIGSSENHPGKHEAQAEDDLLRVGQIQD